MELRITPPNGLKIDNFVNSYLPTKILEVYTDVVDRQRLSLYDKYLNDIPLGQTTKTGKVRSINTYEALYSALSNLIISVDGDSYILTVDQDAILPNFFVRTSTIVGVVNFGTISLKPYPIIDEVFDTVANNMSNYYFEYLQEGV